MTEQVVEEGQQVVVLPRRQLLVTGQHIGVIEIFEVQCIASANVLDEFVGSLFSRAEWHVFRGGPGQSGLILLHLLLICGCSMLAPRDRPT